MAIISFVKIGQTHKKKMAGLLFYFKQSLNVKRRSDIEMSNIETLWTEVSLLNGKPFLICSVYVPSASSDWIGAFEEELSIAQTTGLEFILMGDFNIDITHSMNNLIQLLLHLPVLHSLHRQSLIMSIQATQKTLLRPLYLTMQ